MRVKQLLIITIAAGGLFFVMSNIKQAHAYNMVSAIGAQLDAEKSGGNLKTKATAKKDNAKESAAVEPAAG